MIVFHAGSPSYLPGGKGTCSGTCSSNGSKSVFQNLIHRIIIIRDVPSRGNIALFHGDPHFECQWEEHGNRFKLTDPNVEISTKFSYMVCGCCLLFHFRHRLLFSPYMEKVGLVTIIVQLQL